MMFWLYLGHGGSLTLLINKSTMLPKQQLYLFVLSIVILTFGIVRRLYESLCEQGQLQFDLQVTVNLLTLKN